MQIITLVDFTSSSSCFADSTGTAGLGASAAEGVSCAFAGSIIRKNELKKKIYINVRLSVWQHQAFEVKNN